MLTFNSKDTFQLEGVYYVFIHIIILEWKIKLFTFRNIQTLLIWKLALEFQENKLFDIYG